VALASRRPYSVISAMPATAIAASSPGPDRPSPFTIDAAPLM